MSHNLFSSEYTKVSYICLNSFDHKWVVVEVCLVSDSLDVVTEVVIMRSGSDISSVPQVLNVLDMANNMSG